MTTLEERPNTALLVIDCQNGVVTQAWHRDQVAAKIVDLVEQAHARGVPVVWIQHSSEDLPHGSGEWQIIAELEPSDEETRVHKRFGDSFEETVLDQVLATMAVGKVVICGAETDACVLSTLFGALVRGYDVTLVADAHTTEDRTSYGMPHPKDVINTVNMVWQYRTAPGRTTDVVLTDSMGWS